MSRLLASGLRTESDPDDIAGVGHIRASHLPGLFADGAAEVHFIMQVSPGDAPHQLAELRWSRQLTLQKGGQVL